MHETRTRALITPCGHIAWARLRHFLKHIIILLKKSCLLNLVEQNYIIRWLDSFHHARTPSQIRYFSQKTEL